MNRSLGSPWAWFALALLLAFTFSWAMFDELRVRVNLYLFIPLLTGWLASRFGHMLTSFLFALAPISLFFLSERLFPEFSIRFGIPLWIYVLAIFTAVAFVRPRWSTSSPQVFEARWRWLRWLVLVALWIAVFKSRGFQWSLSETLSIGVNPGFVLLMFVITASVKWSTLCQWLRSECWRGNHTLQKVLTTGVFALLALGLLFYFKWLPYDGFGLRFGFTSAYALIPVVAFLLTAFAILDWRLTVVLLGVFFVSEVAVSWLGDTLAAVLRDESGVVDGAAVTPEAIVSRSLSRVYFNWAGLIQASAAALLGVAIAPFWRSQDPASLHTRRTRLFLFLALVVLFFGMPWYSHHIGNTGLMLVGGAAYIMGLSWQVRGIVAGPLLIQMLYLLGLAVLCIDNSCPANPYEVVNIGLVAFVFAFFGLLSNRYQVLPSGASAPGAEEGRP